MLGPELHVQALGLGLPDAIQGAQFSLNSRSTTNNICMNTHHTICTGHLTFRLNWARCVFICRMRLSSPEPGRGGAKAP